MADADGQYLKDKIEADVYLEQQQLLAKAILVCIINLMLFFIMLPGCGDGGGGNWIAPSSDIISPLVSSTVPFNGATGVPVGNKLTVTFSEAMDPFQRSCGKSCRCAT